MNQIKLLIISLGCSIYYMDTDSIATAIQLADKLVGNKLGQFKLEHLIKKGFFISSKLYCLIIKDVKECVQIVSKSVINKITKLKQKYLALISSKILPMAPMNVHNMSTGVDVIIDTCQRPIM